MTELNLNSTQLSEESMRYLTQNLTPNITKLNLSGFESIKDEDIGALVSRSNKLSTLDLQKTVITNDALATIIRHLGQILEQFDVIDSLDLSLNPLFLVNNINSMSKLKILNCYSRSDESYVSVIAILRHNFPHLNINHFDLTIATPENVFESDYGFWDIEAKKASYYAKT